MSKVLKLMVSVVLAAMLLVSVAAPALAAPPIQTTACWGNGCIIQ